MPRIQLGNGAEASGEKFCIAVGDNSRAAEGEVVIRNLRSPLPLSEQERQKLLQQLGSDDLIAVFGLRLVQLIATKLEAAPVTAPSEPVPSTNSQKESQPTLSDGQLPDQL